MSTKPSTPKTPRKPKTEYVLVRSNRNIQPILVQVVSNDGSFDFKDYRYHRMSEATKFPMEEWVYKDDLKLYKQADKQVKRT